MTKSYDAMSNSLQNILFPILFGKIDLGSDFGTMYNSYPKKIWKLVKILLALIIFYKMITDNDALLKFWFHFVV